MPAHEPVHAHEHDHEHEHELGARIGLDALQRSDESSGAHVDENAHDYAHVDDDVRPASAGV